MAGAVNVENFDFKQTDGYVKIGYDFSPKWKATADYTLMHFKGNDLIYPRLSNSVSHSIPGGVLPCLAMGYRNPSFRELYLYRMANPDLQPEKMMNYELSAGKYFSRYFSADITAYYSRGTDMIQVLDNKNTNTGRFINKGVEITAKSTPLDNLWLFASYSYLHTSLDNLAGAPKSQYYVGAELTLWDKLEIAADLKGVGCLYVADDVKRQNYALLNLKLTYKVCRYADIFVRLENITDARYTINRGYEMPGFTAMGGFKVKI